MRSRSASLRRIKARDIFDLKLLADAGAASAPLRKAQLEQLRIIAAEEGPRSMPSMGAQRRDPIDAGD
jgi:hypothetical protein